VSIVVEHRPRVDDVLGRVVPVLRRAEPGGRRGDRERAERARQGQGHDRAKPVGDLPRRVAAELDLAQEPVLPLEAAVAHVVAEELRALLLDQRVGLRRLARVLQRDEGPPGVPALLQPVGEDEVAVVAIRRRDDGGDQLVEHARCYAGGAGNRR
jgi:hypothetical protein